GMGDPLFGPAPVVADFFGGAGDELDALLVMQAAGDAVADAARAVEEVVAALVKILDVVVAVALDHAGVEGVAAHDPVQGILRQFASAGGGEILILAGGAPE